MGTGRSVPAFVLDNARLSEMVDTSDDWIVSRTGIRERHICLTESLADLATDAASRALSQAGVSARELSLILCATLQGDYVTPSLACTVQKRLEATCPAFDINAACTGFLYALDTAAGHYARRGGRVLVIAAENMSKHIDWNDRATCVLFGDGAGAVVLEQGDNLLASKIGATGNDEFLTIFGSHSRFPGADIPLGKQSVYMNGQEIYRFAVGSMCRDIDDALRTANVSVEDIRFFLVHQANKRILDAAKARLGVNDERMVMTIERYGNTSAASIPIMLDEMNRADRLTRGDLLVFCAFGGGLTTGAAVIRW